MQQDGLTAKPVECLPFPRSHSISTTLLGDALPVSAVPLNVRTLSLPLPTNPSLHVASEGAKSRQ